MKTNLLLTALTGLGFAGAANASLVAGQTLGIDFGDGIHAANDGTGPEENGSGSETNFAVLVQDVGVNRTPGGVNQAGQAISTDITGAALSGVTFTTSNWSGFLGLGDQVGYNAAGTGNYTGTPYSDLSFNDGIYGNNASSVTISGLSDSLNYNLSIASNMFANAAFGATVTEPFSGNSGSYTGTSIINGGTSGGPNPNPITPFTLTGLLTDGLGNLTLNFTNNPIIISALTITGGDAVTPPVLPVLALDFQGTAGGINPNPGVTQAGFTAFNLTGIDAVPATNADVDPSITDGGITFAIDGTVGGFGPAGSGNDDLDRDFMFLGSALGYDESVGWTLSGLDPNSQYELTWYTAIEGNSDRSALIESGGQSGEVRNDNPDLVLTLTSDGSGVITGTATRNGTNGEANLAGLSVVLVPEPSSLAMLGLGGLLIARRRRS